MVKVGDGTVIYNPNLVWLAPDAEIGKNCRIGNFTEIGKEVRIGDRCKVQAFVFIPKGVVIGSDVFIGPNVTFTNDRYPGSAGYGKYESTIVEDGAAIGAGSTIRCGITIGQGASIGAGAVVTKDVPAGETWLGNPARKQECPSCMIDIGGGC